MCERSFFYFHGLQVGVTIALSIKPVRATTFFQALLSVTPHNLHSKPISSCQQEKKKERQKERRGGSVKSGKKTATAS